MLKEHTLWQYSIKSTLTLFSSQPKVSFITAEQEDSIYASFKTTLLIFSYPCWKIGSFTQKKTQTSATVNFNSSELGNFRMFGFGKIAYAILWIQDNVLQLNKWPLFKFSLPLTDQVDITVGVYHTALVWQSPEIRCYCSWLHYWLLVFLYKGCFYLQWNARKEDELIRKNISQEAEVAIDFLWKKNIVK